VAVSIALISTLVGRFLAVTEILKDVRTHGFEQCWKVPAGKAPEDVQLIPGTNELLMGVDDRMALWNSPGKGPKDTPSGGISTMTVPKDSSEKPQIRPIELESWPKGVAFHPHGLYIRNNELYVVNHAYSEGGERVEVFLISNVSAQVRLTYSRSLLLPDYMLGIANEVVFVSEQDFFVSTWLPRADTAQGRSHSLWRSLQGMLGMLLGLEDTYVHRCRGTEGPVECRVVASGLSMNGMTLMGRNSGWWIQLGKWSSASLLRRRK